MKKDHIMKETLICTACSNSWSRQRTRGRKPFLCPSCSSQELPVQPIARSARVRLTTMTEQETQRKTSGFQAPSKWQCPHCLVSMVTSVVIYEAPTHWCKKRLRKIFPLEQVNKIIPNTSLVSDSE